MPLDELGDGEIKLRFTRNKLRATCEIHLIGETEPRVLFCRPASLRDVVLGTRYHFAGSNALCTIYRLGDQICIEVHLDSRSVGFISSLETYGAALEPLKD